MDAPRICLQCGRAVTSETRTCQEGHAWSDPTLPSDLSAQREKRAARGRR